MSGKAKTLQPRPYIASSISNEWSTGVCDCFNDLPSSKKAGECLCLPLLDAFGFIPPITTSMRVSIRHRFGIQGNICHDCVYSCFCGPCTWCQISREMEMRKAPMIYPA